jgi:hypothetical protein
LHEVRQEHVVKRRRGLPHPNVAAGVEQMRWADGVRDERSELPAREEQGPGAGRAPGSGGRWRGAATRAGRRRRRGSLSPSPVSSGEVRPNHCSPRRRRRGGCGELCFRSELGREGGLAACGAGVGPAPPSMKEGLESAGYEGSGRLPFF